MSIHAQSSEEARIRLGRQRRNSTISSVLISALAVVAIFLGLGLYLLPVMIPDEDGLIAYPPVTVTPPDVTPPTVTPSLRPRPIPPSNVRTPVVVARTSSLSIPTVDVPFNAPTADFGNAGGFGDDFGTVGLDSGSIFESIPADLRKRCSKQDRISRLEETGGNPLAENAVEKGLEWLMATQNQDGSWTGKNRAAMTGFAVLAYLGRCETPLSEKYGESCLRGITWLIDLGLGTEGKLSTDLANKHWPYEHAIATYAICEATTFCKQLGIPVPGLDDTARKATEIILGNQHASSGGWDYAYDTSGKRGGDLSIAAWHIQALKAANHTGLDFKGMSVARDAALDYAKSLQNETGGFGYSAKSRPAGGGSYFSMTGGGVLGLQMWGKGKSSRRPQRREIHTREQPF